MCVQYRAGKYAGGVHGKYYPGGSCSNYNLEGPCCHAKATYSSPANPAPWINISITIRMHVQNVYQ